MFFCLYGSGGLACRAALPESAAKDKAGIDHQQNGKHQNGDALGKGGDRQGVAQIVLAVNDAGEGQGDKAARQQKGVNVAFCAGGRGAVLVQEKRGGDHHKDQGVRIAEAGERDDDQR